MSPGRVPRERTGPRADGRRGVLAPRRWAAACFGGGRGVLAPRRWAAAGWAVWAAAVLHRRLRRGPLAEVRVPAPFVAPRPHDRGAIRRALRLARVPCLPTALIWQEWHGRLGCTRDVVVGVRRDDGGAVKAHAWLDGQDPRGDFTALHRRPWAGTTGSLPAGGS